MLRNITYKSSGLNSEFLFTSDTRFYSYPEVNIIVALSSYDDDQVDFRLDHRARKLIQRLALHEDNHLDYYRKVVVRIFHLGTKK